MAIESSLIYPLKIVMFHSYVAVYQRVAYIRPKNKGYGTNVPPHQRILEISHWIQVSLSCSTVPFSSAAATKGHCSRSRFHVGPCVRARSPRGSAPRFSSSDKQLAEPQTAVKRRPGVSTSRPAADEFNPICSMYGIFTYICAIFGVNVGKYSIHGAFGNCLWMIFPWNNRFFLNCHVWLPEGIYTNQASTPRSTPLLLVQSLPDLFNMSISHNHYMGVSENDIYIYTHNTLYIIYNIHNMYVYIYIILYVTL